MMSYSAKTSKSASKPITKLQTKCAYKRNTLVLPYAFAAKSKAGLLSCKRALINST